MCVCLCACVCERERVVSLLTGFVCVRSLVAQTSLEQVVASASTASSETKDDVTRLTIEIAQLRAEVGRGEGWGWIVHL